MAIEIAPVKKDTGLKENLILIASIIILLISSGTYFYLNSVATQKDNELGQVSNELATLAGADVKAKEDELKLAGKDIADFKVLFKTILKPPDSSPLSQDGLTLEYLILASPLISQQEKLLWPELLMDFRI